MSAIAPTGRCDYGECISQAPAVIMSVAVAVGLVLLVAGIVVFRRAWRSFGMRRKFVAPALLGAAVILLLAAALGLRHPGGRVVIPDAESFYTCQPWYVEAGRQWTNSPPSAAGCGSATSSMTLTNIVSGVVAGLVVGVTTFAVLARRNAKLEASLRTTSAGESPG